MIHSWRRPREQRFRPGSRLSNWKNEASARYRHGGQVSLKLSNQMTKLENEIRMLAMAGGEEAQNLNTYRLTPGLLWIMQHNYTSLLTISAEFIGACLSRMSAVRVSVRRGPRETSLEGCAAACSWLSVD